MRLRSLVMTLGFLTGWGLAGWCWFQNANPPPAATTADHNPGAWFEALTADPSLAGASIAWVLLDENGQVLERSPLAETAMCPASVLKTVTTAAALEMLGPEFRFTTEVLSSTPPTERQLRRGLILRGGGDPTLTDGDLKHIAERLAEEGIEEIWGPISVDSSVFPEHPLNDHWNWGDIGNAYGAGAYGLNLNHNRFEIQLRAGSRIGEPVQFTAGADRLPGITWRNHVLTGPAGSGDGVVAYSEPYGQQITLRGTIPLGAAAFPVRLALPDPPKFALERLQFALGQAGIARRRHSLGPSPAGGDPVVLQRHHSAPLTTIITSLHHTSNNLEAQCLFLELGRVTGLPPEQAVTQFWERAGVHFQGLRLLDGSGLARANRIRPLDLARVNWIAAHRGSTRQAYLDSLIRRDHGFVTRSKNGGMSGVRTEVGFVAGKDGRWLTFALMANGLLPGADFDGLYAQLLQGAAAHRADLAESR